MSAWETVGKTAGMLETVAVTEAAGIGKILAHPLKTAKKQTYGSACTQIGKPAELGNLLVLQNHRKIIFCKTKLL